MMVYLTGLLRDRAKLKLIVGHISLITAAWETETGNLRVQGQPGQLRETLSENKLWALGEKRQLT